MKIEGYLFGFMAAFLLPVTLTYWFLSKDPTGTWCLALAIGLAFMIGYYLLFTARRMACRNWPMPMEALSPSPETPR